MAAVILSVLLTVVCVLIHYEVLRWTNARLPRMRRIAERAKVIVAMAAAMASHLVQIALFAAAYHMLRDRFGLGQFGGDFQDVFSSFLYFSAETYTSLGFGDIYPNGPLRLVAGIETLVGLLMIAWSGSYTYLEMRRYWE